MGDLANKGDIEVRYASEFARINAKQYDDTEEVRFDIPVSKVNGVIYVGVAPSGSLESSSVWMVVRTDFDSNGNPNRQRYRSGVAWDSRTTGWV